MDEFEFRAGERLTWPGGSEENRTLTEEEKEFIQNACNRAKKDAEGMTFTRPGDKFAFLLLRSSHYIWGKEDLWVPEQPPQPVA